MTDFDRSLHPHPLCETGNLQAPLGIASRPGNPSPIQWNFPELVAAGKTGRDCRTTCMESHPFFSAACSTADQHLFYPLTFPFFPSKRGGLLFRATKKVPGPRNSTIGREGEISRQSLASLLGQASRSDSIKWPGTRRTPRGPSVRAFSFCLPGTA